jgi:alkylation response protein AidB-like acyl-CoA dehydrogenase
MSLSGKRKPSSHGRHLGKGKIIMDFGLTEEQKVIKIAVREFAEKEFPKIAREAEIKGIFPKDVWKKACGLGLIGPFIPEKYGGAGLGYLETCMITEECTRVDPGVGGNIILLTLGSEVILYYGTDEQKEKYLPPLPKGEWISCLAVTEPNAGSDVAEIQTTALKHGNEWVLNGSKVLITNGSIADYAVVLAITDPDQKDRHRKFSTFVIETNRVGYKATKIEGKMGMRASDTADIELSDMRVPEENIIGKRGLGFYNIMGFFDRSRIYIGAQGVGIAQGALDLALKYAKERVTFGRPLISNQGIQFTLAEMKTRVEAARYLVYRAAWQIDQNIIDPTNIAVAKWYAAECGVKNCDESLQIHGGYGYINEYDIERFYRAAKLIEIYEGAKQIEKIIIARGMIKGF